MINYYYKGVKRIHTLAVPAAHLKLQRGKEPNIVNTSKQPNCEMVIPTFTNLFTIEIT